MQHTPGPWTVERGDGFFIPEICGHIDDHNENYDADAVLVCAAPDLLEALKEIRSDMNTCSTMDGSTWNKMEAAIAKAEGR